MIKRAARKVADRLHGHRMDRGMQAGSARDLPLTEDQLAPGWLLDGAPTLRSAQLTTTDNGRFTTGVWESTAGRYRWHFDFDEVVHIIDGEVHVTEGGETRVLRPGDVAFFPMGTDTVWEIPEYVRKMYTHRQPNAVVKRLRRVAA